MKNKNNLFSEPAILIGLILLNCFLKIIFISSPSIAGDEPFSIYYSQWKVSSIISFLFTGNNPPLFEIILHYWIQLFGISPLSVRFLPLIFSSATVYFIYKTGIKFFNFRVALTASLLFTFSNFHLLHSHECRVYSLFALLTVISMFAFLNLCETPKKISNQFLILATNILLIYAHYFGFFVLLIQLICLFSLAELRIKLLKTYLLIHVIVIILFIPAIPVIVRQLSEASAHGTWLKQPDGIESLYNMLWSFSNAPVVTVMCLAVLFISLLKLIITKDFKNGVPSKLVITWFVFPLLLMFALSYRVPMFLNRYLIYVSPGYFFVLALGVNYLFKKEMHKNILSTLLIILFAVTFKANGDNKRQVRETIEKIRELKERNAIVVFCPADFSPNFSYYYNPGYFTDTDEKNNFSKLTGLLNNEKIFPINNINDLDQNELSRASKIIYLDAAADFSFPGNNILNSLQKNHSNTEHIKFKEIFNIYVFTGNKLR